MVLSDKEILKFIESGHIKIEPFDIKNMGGNSYDVHLSKYFAQYVSPVIDAKKHNEVKHFEIEEDGFMLEPGKLYLGSTLEYTETHLHVPFLEGKSSTGRLGIDIHATAGKGDVGFCNYWTLEISTSIAVRVYPGMPIGQLIYHEVAGDVERVYNKKDNAKYVEKDPRPKESMMWKNQF